jgi:hypothetical protein
VAKFRQGIASTAFPEIQTQLRIIECRIWSYGSFLDGQRVVVNDETFSEKSFSSGSVQQRSPSKETKKTFLFRKSLNSQGCLDFMKDL